MTVIFMLLNWTRKLSNNIGTNFSLFVNKFIFSANASATIQIQETLTNKPIKLQNIPNDEVFGIILNENFYRAVKCDKNSKNKLFLLDVGEIYTLTELPRDIYQLSDECKKLPAQAILCKMETEYASIFLQQNKYTKQQFNVESVNL